MATRPSTLVGVFHDKITADRTIEQLRDAGFTNQQISYSAGVKPGGGFIEAVRHFFSGPHTSSGDVAGDLVRMGVPEEEARYYAHEHDIGHHLVAVTLTERFQDALTLLYQNGAYHYDRKTGSAQPMSLSQSQLDTALPYDMGSEIPDYSAPRSEKERESYYNAPVDYQTQTESTSQAATPDQSSTYQTPQKVQPTDINRGQQATTQPGAGAQPNVTQPGIRPPTGQGYGAQPSDYGQETVGQPGMQKPVYGQQGDQVSGTPDYSAQPPGSTRPPFEKIPGRQDASTQQPFASQKPDYTQQGGMAGGAQGRSTQPDYTQQGGMAGGVQSYGTQPDYTPPSGMTPSGQGFGAQTPFKQPDDVSAQGILPPQPDVSQHPGVSPKGIPNQPGTTPRPETSQARPLEPEEEQPFIDPMIAERERWMREQGNQSGDQR